MKVFTKPQDLGRERPPGFRARQFTRADLLSFLMHCPGCGQMLAVIDAVGPFDGINPQDMRLDRFWDCTLADGAHATFWEDGKGILEFDDSVM